MEIATSSSALHLFPKDRRVKTKGVRYNLIDFSVPINPKLDLEKSQILSRTGRDDKEKYDVVAGPKKRQYSGEENPPEKRQKKTVEVDSTNKVKSITTSTPNLYKKVSESKQEKKTKVTKPVDARAITTKATKPENSITVSSKACLHETETKPNGNDLRNLVAKAQHQIQKKRQIDHRKEDITRQRIAARLAINQMVPSVSFDHHLDYHRELEQLGYTFIHDQVDCLNMFNLWSRSDYNGVTNSVFTKNKTPWGDERFKEKETAEINERKKHGAFPATDSDNKE